MFRTGAETFLNFAELAWIALHIQQPLLLRTCNNEFDSLVNTLFYSMPPS